MYRKGQRKARCARIGEKHFEKNIFKQVLTEVSLWGFAGGRGNLDFLAYTHSTIWTVSLDRQGIPMVIKGPAARIPALL